MRIAQEAASEPPNLGNVVELFAATPCPRRAPPPSEAELIEYREMRPRLLAMLAEWDTIKSSHGCPVARQVLGK